MNRACSDCGHSPLSHAHGKCAVLLGVEPPKRNICNCTRIFPDESSLGVSRNDLPFGAFDPDDPSKTCFVDQSAQESLRLHPPPKPIVTPRDPMAEELAQAMRDTIALMRETETVYDDPRQGPTYTYVKTHHASGLYCAGCHFLLLKTEDGLLTCLDHDCPHRHKLLMPPVVPLLVVDGPCSPYPREAP